MEIFHLKSILLFTALDYDGNSYSDYTYPTWANVGGWMITFSSVILIPIVAIKKICQEEGSFKQVREMSLINLFLICFLISARDEADQAD